MCEKGGGIDTEEEREHRRNVRREEEKRKSEMIGVLDLQLDPFASKLMIHKIPLSYYITKYPYHITKYPVSY